VISKKKENRGTWRSKQREKKRRKENRKRKSERYKKNMLLKKLLWLMSTIRFLKKSKKRRCLSTR
jgi:hypothetical protein